MRTLSHPSIVRAFEIHESAANVVVCMEYCEGGSLEDHVKSCGALAPAVATPGALQVLQALDYLHICRRIVHRDVKPANILLSGGTAQFKLADFNSAKQIGSHDALGCAMLTCRGTACYSAPEIHAGRVWNERVDLWSVGLSICFMRLGRLPFDVEHAGVRRALARGAAPPLDLAGLGGLLGSLVRQCLEADPGDRPPAVELLAHPVFREGSRIASGPSAYADELVPTCGLVWRLPGAEAVRVANCLDGHASVRRVFTSPPAERDQRPLWRRLATRRYSRDVFRTSVLPSRRQTVC
ncbi:unnamed protein product [Prorocentrum cordatum]|uniref:Protein kinase domain-containing protein n=1 Tax=Prorocentrum cordatum TaxID=2364126 RepID=A0ABN9XM70_9DINO|nr:unnamed protein product [Polarella glacialis]